MEEKIEKKYEYFEHVLTLKPSFDALCHICNLSDDVFFSCEGFSPLFLPTSSLNFILIIILIFSL